MIGSVLSYDSPLSDSSPFILAQGIFKGGVYILATRGHLCTPYVLYASPTQHTCHEAESMIAGVALRGCSIPGADSIPLTRCIFPFSSSCSLVMLYFSARLSLCLLVYEPYRSDAASCHRKQREDHCGDHIL